MAITKADVDSRMESAETALLAGDPTTALRYAIAAQGLLSVLPDSKKGDEEIKWPLGRIDAFIANVRRYQTDVAIATNEHGVRTSKITYARTSA